MIKPNSSPSPTSPKTLYTFGLPKISTLLLVVLLSSCGSGRFSPAPQAPCNCGLLDDAKKLGKELSDTTTGQKIESIVEELQQILVRWLGAQARQRGISTTPETVTSDSRFGRPGDDRTSLRTQTPQGLQDFMGSLGLTPLHYKRLEYGLSSSSEQLQIPMNCEDEERYHQLVQELNTLQQELSSQSTQDYEAYTKAIRRTFYTVLCVIEHDNRFPVGDKLSQIKAYMDIYISDLVSGSLGHEKTQDLITFAARYAHGFGMTPLQKRIVTSIELGVLERVEKVSADLRCKITSLTPLSSQEQSVVDSLTTLPFSGGSSDYELLLNDFEEIVGYIIKLKKYEEELKYIEENGTTRSVFGLTAPTQPRTRAWFEEFVVQYNQDNNTQYTTESFVSDYASAWLIGLSNIECDEFSPRDEGTTDIAIDPVVKDGFEQTSGFEQITLGSMTGGTFIKSLETNGNTECPLELTVTFFYLDETSTNRNYDLLAHNQGVGMYRGPQDLAEINDAILRIFYTVQNLPTPNGFALAISINGPDGELVTAKLRQ